MKKLKLKVLSLLLILISGVLVAQFYSQNKQKMQHIITKVWYNFEGDEAAFKWKASSFNIAEKTFVKRYKGHVPNGLGESKADSKESLGIKASFSRKGYNWIDIYPEASKAKGRFIGNVKSIDMWVWGGNFLYKLNAVIEDYKGYRYTLNMGNLRYYGWRNKEINIPPSIPQAEPYAPRSKGLKFNKFRIYSTPAERVDRFHCFFDYFKIVTDVYRDQYDGWDLEKVISEEIGDAAKVEGNKTSTSTPAGN